MIWGMAGRKRSGKNTSADFLTAEYGFVQVSLAEPLRELLLVTDPMVPSDRGYRRLSEVLDEHGSFEGVKNGDVKAHLEVRRLMQRAGTEWGRSVMNGCVWIMALEDYLDKNIKGWWNERGPRVVVTDVRFPNEARWIRLHRGKVINVERPSVVRDDWHPSEAGIDPALADYHVYNLGTREELHGQLRNIYDMEMKTNVAFA